MDLNKAVEALVTEGQAIQKKVAELDENRSRLVTRFVEIQGILKFLQGSQPPAPAPAPAPEAPASSTPPAQA